MPLRLSIINDRIAEYISSAGDAPDLAFTKLVYAIFRDSDYDDLQPEDIVDGGEDKQLDVLNIEEDPVTGTADLLVLQTKNTESFSSNGLTVC